MSGCKPPKGTFGDESDTGTTCNPQFGNAKKQMTQTEQLHILDQEEREAAAQNKKD